jgi:hypothetical protein
LLKDTKEFRSLAVQIAEILVEQEHSGRGVPVLTITAHSRTGWAYWLVEKRRRTRGIWRSDAPQVTWKELLKEITLNVRAFRKQSAFRTSEPIRDLERSARLVGVAEPSSVDRLHAARVEAALVLSEILVRERREQGDVQGLVCDKAVSRPPLWPTSPPRRMRRPPSCSCELRTFPC